MEKVKSVIYKGWHCDLLKSYYAHGNRVALCLVAGEKDECPGEPVSTCTVNLPDEPLGEGEVFIKDYSENEGMVEFLVKEGVVEKTGREVRSGYIAVPVCKLLIGV